MAYSDGKTYSSRRVFNRDDVNSGKELFGFAVKVDLNLKFGTPTIYYSAEILALEETGYRSLGVGSAESSKIHLMTLKMRF